MTTRESHGWIPLCCLLPQYRTSKYRMVQGASTNINFNLVSEKKGEKKYTKMRTEFDITYVSEISVGFLVL